MSKHLSVLLQVGLVEVRRDGRQAFYRNNANQIRVVFDWTKRFEKHWQTQLLRVQERSERAARIRQQHPHS